MSEHVAVPKVATQAAEHSGALGKLLAFSLTLAFVPISSYFASEKYLWNGNSTFAAVTAIVAANIVLAAYIVVSIREDKQSQAAAPIRGESRKTK